jgi:hypothetical protein
MLNCK